MMPILIKIWKPNEYAKDLCFDFNQTRPSDDSRRQAILTELFGYTLENVAINSPFDTDYGWNVKLGKNVFVNSNCYFMDGGGITIGMMYL